MSRAVRFYQDKKSGSSFTYSQVMAMSEHEWEAHHNFIQWLFPNNEKSMVVPDAPLTTKSTVLMFNKDKDLQSKLKKAFKRFLNHVGLTYSKGSVTISDPGLVFLRIQRRDHNRLRLTRVLRSMRLLGLPKLAIELYRFLLTLDGIDQITLDFWEDAVSFNSLV